MKIRVSFLMAMVAAIALPVWAHCGSCGVGEKKNEHAKEHAKEHADEHAQAEIGKPAPDFTLKDADGKEYKLSTLKGKVVVLEWTNHECPVVNRCHKAKYMSDTLTKFKGKPVVWLAIDSSHFCQDKSESVRKWAEQQKLEYPILLDAAGKVGHAYQAKTTPHMFVIDQKGVLAYRGALDNDPYGNKEEGKQNYVLEAVDSLLQGSTVVTATTKSYGCSVKYKQ